MNIELDVKRIKDNGLTKGNLIKDNLLRTIERSRNIGVRMLGIGLIAGGSLLGGCDQNYQPFDKPQIHVDTSKETPDVVKIHKEKREQIISELMKEDFSQRYNLQFTEERLQDFQRREAQKKDCPDCNNYLFSHAEIEDNGRFAKVVATSVFASDERLLSTSLYFDFNRKKPLEEVEPFVSTNQEQGEFFDPNEMINLAHALLNLPDKLKWAYSTFTGDDGSKIHKINTILENKKGEAIEITINNQGLVILTVIEAQREEPDKPEFLLK